MEEVGEDGHVSVLVTIPGSEGYIDIAIRIRS